MNPPFVNPNGTPPASIRSARLVVLLLAFGVLAFTIFAAANTALRFVPTSGANANILLIALAAFAASIPGVLFVVSASFIKQARNARDSVADETQREARLRQLYAMRAITLGAMIEGVGLFGAVILFITGAWAALVAPVIACAALLTLVPGESGYQSFLHKLARAG